MALDQLSEYIYIKDSLEQEKRVNRSLLSRTDAYNFSVDGILEEFLGSLYGWGNFNTVVLITLYVPTFAIAFLGNILVIFTVTSRKTLRQVRNYYLVNLAFADLTITLLCMPTSVGSIIHRLWVYGQFLCKAATFLQGVAVAASIFTLMAMSIDRFVSIQYPTSKRRVKKFSEAIIMIVLIWTVSAAIMTPLLLVREVDEIPLPHFESLGFCVEKWGNHDHRLAFGVVSLLVVFIIPATILAVCYVRIGETIYSKEFERVNSNSSVQTVTSRKRTARMLVILVVLFLVFWLPYNITSLVMDIAGQVSQVGVLRYALWLGHAHSAVNPVMYWSLNKRLRDALNSMWPFCCESEQRQTRRPPPPPARQANVRFLKPRPNVVVISTRPARHIR